MVHPFLQVRCEPSVPCLSHFVYQMDKVELSVHETEHMSVSASGVTLTFDKLACH